VKNLIIYTICEENTSYPNWDGLGKCPEYWVSKPGNIYVFADVNAKSEDKIKRDGIPTLESIIRKDNYLFREYVYAHELLNPTDKFCADFEMNRMIRWLEYDSENQEWFYRLSLRDHYSKKYTFSD
jgi:hypothetical protein